MQIGVPREVKVNEGRVGLTPAGVRELTARGHSVVVEASAGLGSGIEDYEYVDAGATVLPSAQDVSSAEMILKVKEPVASEYQHLRAGQTIFTYLHLAADLPLVDALVASGATAIAYETVQLSNGKLPLLAPMSEIAGRIASQVAAHMLMTPSGGPGVLPGGIAGVARSHFTVIGGGVAGSNAAAVALGLGADVTLIDTDVERLRQLEVRFPRLATRAASVDAVEATVAQADVVVGCVLIPGARAPKLVSSDFLARLKRRTVLVDVAIDQGGCFEASRPTTHDAPSYSVDDCVYYCVTNMPGAVPRTATHALTNVTLPYAVRLADRGWMDALRDDPALALGLNTHAGYVTNSGVAEAHDLAYTAISDVLA